MFAVIYRSYLKPGKDHDYLKSWRLISNFFVEHKQALGSCIHKAEDGMWVVYSRWPDKQMRDQVWSQDGANSNDLPEYIKEAAENIKDCIDKTREMSEIFLALIDEKFK